MNERQKRVADLCDGARTSAQIAAMIGEKQKYVQEVAQKFDLPRRSRGSAFGELNGSYKSGRRVDRDGYVLVSAPLGHPYARLRPDRNTGMIYEHRLLMEQKLGRLLDPLEVVDHIDGLRLHNDTNNLRLFCSNAAHLTATISGQTHELSAAGREKLRTPRIEREHLQPVHTYNRMKKNGDARLRQILLAVLKLGIDSPYLLGTHHHLRKAGISDFSHSSLEHELGRLSLRYA